MGYANRTRHTRVLNPGEVVFRRLPKKAQPAKHLLEPPSDGPYVVVRQATLNSVQLKDLETGEMVAEGADIPLEQILAGPRRSMLRFEPVDNGRSVGEMIRGRRVCLHLWLQRDGTNLIK